MQNTAYENTALINSVKNQMGMKNVNPDMRRHIASFAVEQGIFRDVTKCGGHIV